MSGGLGWDSPIAKRLVTAAADLWSGSEVPDWRENEYARGQVELLMDSIDVTLPFEDDLEGEEAKDRIVRLMRGQEMVPRETLTEDELTARFKGYEGDALSAGTYDVVVKGWQDVTETPSQCIERLNREVIEASRRENTAVHNAQLLLGDRQFHASDWELQFSEDAMVDHWWIELRMAQGETAASELSLTDVEWFHLIDEVMHKIADGRRKFGVDPDEETEGEK